MKVSKKSGAVIRLSSDVVEFLVKRKKAKESMDRTLRRLLGIPNRNGTLEAVTGWVLPGDIHHSRSDAKGVAIMLKVQGGMDKAEVPMEVVVRG